MMTEMEFFQWNRTVDFDVTFAIVSSACVLVVTAGLVRAILRESYREQYAASSGQNATL